MASCASCLSVDTIPAIVPMFESQLEEVKKYQDTISIRIQKIEPVSRCSWIGHGMGRVYRKDLDS